MKVYTYTIKYPADHPTAKCKSLKVICEGENILEADKAFQNICGFHPAKPEKGVYVGCQLGLK